MSGNNLLNSYLFNRSYVNSYFLNEEIEAQLLDGRIRCEVNLILESYTLLLYYTASKYNVQLKYKRGVAISLKY